MQFKYVENVGLADGIIVGTVGTIDGNVDGLELVEVTVGAIVLSVVGTAVPPYTTNLPEQPYHHTQP